MRVASRERVNANIKRASIGVMAKVDDLGLARKEGCTRSREGCGNKLHHEKYTGPWTVKRLLQTGLGVEVEMLDRRTRKRTVATSALRLFNDGWHAEAHRRHLCAKTLQRWVARRRTPP